MKIYTNLTPKECLKRINNPQAYLGEINRKKYSSYFVDKEDKTKKGKRLQIEVNDISFEIYIKTLGMYRRNFMEFPRIRQLGLLKGRIYESETEGTIIRYHMNACVDFTLSITVGYKVYGPLHSHGDTCWDSSDIPGCGCDICTTDL